MAVTTRLQAEPFDAADELRAFSAGRTLDGAVVSFTGLARGRAHSGEAVETLVLDHYPGMTERSIEEIAEAAAGFRDHRLDFAAQQVRDAAEQQDAELDGDHGGLSRRWWT